MRHVAWRHRAFAPPSSTPWPWRSAPTAPPLTRAPAPAARLLSQSLPMRAGYYNLNINEYVDITQLVLKELILMEVCTNSG